MVFKCSAILSRVFHAITCSDGTFSSRRTIDSLLFILLLPPPPLLLSATVVSVPLEYDCRGEGLEEYMREIGRLLQIMHLRVQQREREGLSRKMLEVIY